MHQINYHDFTIRYLVPKDNVIKLLKHKNFAVLQIKREIRISLGFHVWSAELQNFHAVRIKALLSGTELSYIYLSMLLYIALKFPIIPRPRPAFPTVITAKYIFLSELRKRKNKQKTFVSMKISNALNMFFSFSDGFFWRERGEIKMKSLLLWIIFFASQI